MHHPHRTEDRLSVGTQFIINLWSSEYVIYAIAKQAQKLQQWLKTRSFAFSFSCHQIVTK